MKIKIAILSLVSVSLLSCSDGRKPLVYDDVQMSSGVSMTPARGVNIEVMDDHLSSLLNEAGLIESQLNHLINRLASIKHEISGYNSEVITTQSSTLQEPPMLEKIIVRDDVTFDGPAIVNPAIIEPAAPVTTQKVTTTKAKVTTQGVNNVRYGIHSDKIRLVFDTDTLSTNTMSFDKEAGIVTISMPKTQWSASKSAVYNLSQLSGYEAKQSGQGTIVALAVKNTSDVKLMSLSSPNRVVIDLIQ